MAERGTGLERESLAINGVRSQLVLDGGVITIVKEATTQATPTRVQIPVASVRGSTVQAPRRGGRGWLHIACSNGSPAPVGELAASGDPYALPITAKNVGACRKLAKLIDRHVKERGMPADVGPNQGRFTSGVVVTPGVKAVVKAPMVTLPDVPEPAPEPTAAAPAPATPATPKAVSRKAAAKKTAAKVATKKVATKKATRKKATAARPAAGSGDRAAAASELVGQLRELGELHAAGVLDDREFAAAKAKILG